ncbi:cytochrome P450 [Actinosynnema pretiosum subsp. pretiosum]|uniref:Cytochrome P450 n=1 Tax=Actinosynnema pretiosum subsp. pretiosum TaxID=103721 RepID=A0AA45L9P9_9PSEU|nr:putative cytochrome P450 hydroxylase [Actinosynnema pretiosum subsp. pretiosum]QUF05817.1 cytochrome P450 [Actinosynnema pretiosum subsp. pretiosum]
MTRSPEEPLAVPQPRPGPYEPPAGYRSRGRLPKARTPAGADAWLVTGWHDLRAVLADPRFSSDRAHPAFPTLVPGQRGLTTRNGRTTLIAQDPPAHTASRRAVLGEFTVRRVRAMSPRIAEIVEGCLDDLLAGPRPADLVAALALPVPSLVVCELLGVPYADHDFFQSRTADLVRRGTSDADRARAGAEVQEYLSGLVAAKRRAPGDDLLGRLIVKQREAGGEDHDDLVLLGTLLLLAGHETTASTIALGALALLERPEVARELREDPALLPGAVEELLRLLSVVETATSRLAKADVVVGGRLVRAGEGVIGPVQTANHDPEVFPDPHVLDVRRPQGKHLAFGFGPHQCLGQHLAREELRIVFGALLRRIPTLALAVRPETLSFKDNANVYGLHALPVTW